jgi:serine protease Do
MIARRLDRWQATVRFVFAALLFAGIPALAADPVKWDPARTTAPETAAELKALQDAVQSVVQKCTPATVGVKLENEVVVKGKKQFSVAQGSGVIVSADGLVLTAAHVISPEPPTSYKAGRDVTLVVNYGNQVKEVKGKTLGVNRKMDSGMIQITEKGPNNGKWPYIPVAKSSAIKRGQWLVTLGHPGGYEPGRPPVARLGRFQGIEKSIRGAEMNLLRTDTTIVGGDSGGPLFDLAGNVVGIHSQIGPPLDVNLHVATDTFKTDWDALLAGEVLPPPPAAVKLGVEFDEKGTGGGLVKEALKDEPAAVGGMQDGDIIVNFDGKKVASADDVRALLRKKKPGDEVEVIVKRGDETVTLTIKLGKK